MEKNINAVHNLKALIPFQVFTIGDYVVYEKIN
jgi:hypothetical protein